MHNERATFLKLRVYIITNPLRTDIGKVKSGLLQVLRVPVS